MLAAVALGALVVVVVLDQRRLAAEDAAVSRCRDRAQQVAELADARLDRTATYLSPARVPDADLAGALLSDAARRAREPVRRARRACAAVEVRAWHPTTARRRANVADYLDARLAALEEIAEDGRRYYDPAGAEQLARLRERAFAGPP